VEVNVRVELCSSGENRSDAGANLAVGLLTVCASIKLRLFWYINLVNLDIVLIYCGKDKSESERQGKDIYGGRSTIDGGVVFVCYTLILEQ